MRHTDALYMTHEERVSAGAEQLDQYGPPEWWLRVDYDVLNIADGDECILGQVYAPEAATSAFGGYGVALFEDDESPLRHCYGAVSAYGFCGNGKETDADELRTAWIEFIESRKAVLELVALGYV